MGKVTLIGSREAAGISAIGEVVQHRGIKITVGVKPVPTDHKVILAAGIRDCRRARSSIKTSPACADCCLQPGRRSLVWSDFTTAPHLSPPFSTPTPPHTPHP